MKSHVWTSAIAVASFVALAHAADLKAMAIVKKGSCPSGYSTSGGYCAPNSSANFALAKVSSCPGGYSTSGDYCLASKIAKHALPKVGSCPSNYSTSGAYCLSNK